jgi:ABC-type branched-subunit amino acid transport system ATPase component
MVAYLLSVGSIVLQGTPQAIKDEGQLLNAYLGGAH